MDRHYLESLESDGHAGYPDHQSLHDYSLSSPHEIPMFDFFYEDELARISLQTIQSKSSGLYHKVQLALKRLQSMQI